MANEVYEKWLEYYDNNGLSWLATQVQASIKQAFFAGYEAAEQSVQPTLLTPEPACKICKQYHSFAHVEPRSTQIG